MIRPLGDYVVIKRMEAEQKTQGGIILTSASQEVPQVAEVLAVGPEVEVLVNVGDKVVFKKYGGTDIDYNGEELIILPAIDILGVLE